MAKVSRVSDQLELMKTDLESQRDEVYRQLSPLQREREALVAKIQPLEDQLREVDTKIKQIEAPLYAIGNDLAKLARVGGARVVQNGDVAEAEVEAEPTAKSTKPTKH